MPKSAQIPNYKRYRSQIFLEYFQDLTQDCVKMLRTYLKYCPSYKPLNSGVVGLRWVILEIDSGQKKNWILSEDSTTTFKNFMHCPQFPYIHAEGASRALREDVFVALASLRS